MTMNIRPLHDRVIIRRIDEEKTSAGGIVIPDSVKEKPIKGEVLAVGSGKVLDDGKTRKLDVEVGNVVLFGKYAGTEVKVNNEDLLVLREEDIMGVVVAK
jgi:chaperonin GroES